MRRFSMPDTAVPPSLQRLADSYDPQVLELARPRARVRLEGAGPEPVDAVLDGHTVRLEPADGERPDAMLSADEHTWEEIAEDVRGGMEAFRARCGAAQRPGARAPAHRGQQHGRPGGDRGWAERA